MKFLNLKNNIKNNSGFTMIESLVAIFIILLAITGPMVFAQNGLRTAFLSRDQITAFFLAQDVIESIKNYRNGQAKNIVDGTLDSQYWLGNNTIQSGQNGAGAFTDCFDTSSNPTSDIKGCTIITRDGPASSAGNVVYKCSSPSSSDSSLGCLDDSNSEIYKPLNYWDGQITGCSNSGLGVIFSGGKDSCTRSTIFAREISMKYIDSNEVEITVKVRWKSHEGIGIREIKVKENVFNFAGALLNN